MSAVPHLLRPPPVLTTAVIALGVFAGVASIYYGKGLLLPVVVASLIAYTLSPIVRKLDRWHIPPPLGAGLVVGVLLLILVNLGVVLAEPAGNLIGKLPGSLSLLQERVVKPLEETIETVQATSEGLGKIGLGTTSGAVAVRLEENDGLADVVWEFTPRFFGAVVSTIILLYFILGYKDVLLLRLVQLSPRLRDKRRIVEIFTGIEAGLSKYLFTITAVNISLGVVVGTLLWVLGMPNPLLWGTLAAALNFVPYLGSVLGVCALGITALMTFEEPSKAAVCALAYAGATLLEGNFLTPMILGRSFILNPIFVILGILFWGWVWGIAGALVAVPILVAFMVVCRNTPPLQPVFTILTRNAL